MSRQIDLSEPLSKEDREWLLNNNRAEDVRANDAEHGRDSADLGAAPGTATPLVTGQEPSLGSDRTYPVGLTPDSRNADLDRDRRERQFRAALDPERPEDTDQNSVDPFGQRGFLVETDDRPYEDWDKTDLQAEAGKRELAKSGNKAELAERLRADDAERAELDNPEVSADDNE